MLQVYWILLCQTVGLNKFNSWKKIHFTGHKISFTELLSIAFHDKPIDLDISDEIESNNLKSESTDSESSKKVFYGLNYSLYAW